MNIVYEYLFIFLLSIVSVFILTHFIIKLALRINFVDNPAARKVHKKAIPLMGGIAVFTGFIIFSVYGNLLLADKSFDLPVLGFLAGATLIVLVGIIDDKFGMQPMVKMGGQLLVCLVFLFTNDYTEILGPVYITVPILTLWMIGLMNALNFLDNMDGIISGMAAILAFGFYAFNFICKTNSNVPQIHYMSLLSLTFAGSLLGFLPHNFNPAKIFLGDAGSMFIGYFLGTMGIITGRMAVIRTSSNWFYLIPVLLLSFAIFDISLVSITRKRDGRRVSQGGKDHSTHRIGTAMGSTKVTALIVYLINCIIVLTTILIMKMQSVNLLVSSTLIFAVVFLFFANKLDKVPIVVPKNQLKESKS